MSGELQDRRVIVVGAASGIGEATADLCASRGANVIRADRTLAARIDLVGDITNADDCERLVAEGAEILGGIDSIVITAGGGGYASIANTDELMLLNLYRLNVIGPALIVRAALPYLKRSNQPSIVVCASAAGLRSYPEFSAYGSAKAALVRWVKGAAWELAGDGVRVNCVSPGPIDTPMLRAHQPEGFAEDEWVVEVAKHTAMRRAGTVREVAEPIAFLISPGASYLTGVILPADGGEVA